MRRLPTDSKCPPAPLINTPLQRGERMRRWSENRFSGFRLKRETAEAVQGLARPEATPLKRGANENGVAAQRGTCEGTGG
jgi:hypothetical protein